MVLGLSLGQLLVALGASAALFGPKDIVIIGRAAGRYTGKAVGYIQSARGEFAPLMHQSEINTVHKELRETMAQLEAIRAEMRVGMSIMNTGPVTNYVFENGVPPPHSSPAQPSGKGTENAPDLNQQAPVNHASSGMSSQLSPTQMQALQSAWKQGNSAASMTAGASATASALPSRVGNSPGGVGSVLKVSQESKHSNGPAGITPGQELVVLPISAVEAGLLPEPISGGADIVFASIVERKVAFQSKKFLQEGGT